MLWTCLREEYTCVNTFQIHNEIRYEGGIKGDDLSTPFETTAISVKVVVFQLQPCFGKGPFKYLRLIS